MDIDLSAPEHPIDPITEVRVEDDGSVTVTIGPAAPKIDPRDVSHGDNLADALDDMHLGLIAEDLLQGIAQDDMSRSEWLEARAEGIKLLGLRMENRGSGSGSMEGMSTVRHPLLLEAVLRHQANARSELLPVDGIVKIRDDGQSQADDALATALERGMNHYLTVTATEYGPDTDRMLFWSGFGGLGIKKVYPCPLRRRPVSESVDAADIIVSNSATDIQNAPRVTHKISMNPITLKRMQIVGAYRDVELGYAGHGPEQNAVDQEKEAVEGVSVQDFRPEDRERTILECYCFLDLPGFEHAEKGKPTGLPLPYKVTIDEESRQILEIRRNFDPDDDEDALPVRKQIFVPFVFVPGMGFYGIGLLHILGNTTNALTGLTRIMIDAGMLGNFPGGLISEDAMRQDTVSFRPNPGEYLKIKTLGKPVQDSIMPLPYKTPDPATMELVQALGTLGQRIGGTAEIAVGEGRQDAPVGTTLALMEASGKAMDAVHKRYCAAQQVELGLLLDLFREMPEAFWRGNKRTTIQDEQTLLMALDDYDLVPVADPNTSSHMQRIQKMQALQMMAKTLGPMANLYFDVGEIEKASVEMLQLPNGARFLNPNPPPAGWMPPPQNKGAGGGAPPPPPDPVDNQAKMMTAGATVADAQTRSKLAEAKIQNDQAALALKAHEAQQGLGVDPLEAMDARTRQLDAQTRARGLEVDERNNLRDATNQAADRESEDHIAALSAVKDLAMHSATITDQQAARETESLAVGLGQ